MFFCLIWNRVFHFQTRRNSKNFDTTKPSWKKISICIMFQNSIPQILLMFVCVCLSSLALDITPFNVENCKLILEYPKSVFYYFFMSYLLSHVFLIWSLLVNMSWRPKHPIQIWSLKKKIMHVKNVLHELWLQQNDGICFKVYSWYLKLDVIVRAMIPWRVNLWM